MMSTSSSSTNDFKTTESKFSTNSNVESKKSKRAPVETITSFGHEARIPKTKHWGLSNLLGPGSHFSSNRAQSFNIPSSLSSENNMIMKQPILQRRVRMLACSQKSTVALLVGGEMYTWGEDDNSIGGNDNEIPIIEESYDSVMWPRRIKFDKEVIFVAAGHDHFAALTVETKYNLYTWGKNTAGQLGHGDKQNKKYPRKIISWKTRKAGNKDYGDSLLDYVKDDLSNIRIVQVTCSYKFTLAVTDNNRVFGFGKNDKGQLGLCCATPRDDLTMGAERRKRIIAFSKLFVIWPVELEEMKALGYNQDAVVSDDDQVTIAQLMIAAGTNHATSWMHLENLNQFSRAYRAEHENLKKRVQQLEEEASHLRRYATKIKGGEGDSSSTSNDDSAMQTANSIINQTRRVTDDVTLNATGQLLNDFHSELLSKQV